MKKLLLSVAGTMLVFTFAPKTTHSAQPPPAALQQQASPQKTKIFSGTIIKSGEGYVLSDAANKLSFALDDSEQASHYEGKKVKVTGTVDTANNVIHVEAIQEIA
jgi:uncharacterized protein YdeI (BOF family)